MVKIMFEKIPFSIRLTVIYKHNSVQVTIEDDVATPVLDEVIKMLISTLWSLTPLTRKEHDMLDSELYHRVYKSWYKMTQAKSQIQGIL